MVKKETKELDSLEKIELVQEKQKETNKEIEKMDLDRFWFERLRGQRLK